MSQSSLGERFNDLGQNLAALLSDMADSGRSSELSNERLGQLFAAVVRVYADKVQNGEDVRPFGGNAGLAVTDVAIACTAMMDAVNLELFELGGWQTMSGLGKLRAPAHSVAPARSAK